MNNDDRHAHWLRVAYEEATKSPDPSTQNGAVLVNEEIHHIDSQLVTRDHNRFPDNVFYNDVRWERPLKYKVIEHAERNVIYKAASVGEPTKGLTMVCAWAACSDCARGIIQSGIKKLVTHKQAADRSPSFWEEEIKVAFEMLEEAGVEVVMFDGKLNAPEVRHSGEVWTP